MLSLHMNNQSLEERASHLVTQHTKEEIIKYSRREVLEYLGKVAIYAAELGGLAYFLSACKGGSRDGGSSPTGPTQPTWLIFLVRVKAAVEMAEVLQQVLLNRPEETAGETACPQTPCIICGTRS